MLNVDERSNARNMQNTLFGEDKQGGIVLGVFINGDSVIHNVPYSKHYRHDSQPEMTGGQASERKTRENGTKDGVGYDLFLTHDVLFQLSHIIKTMQEQQVQTVDYQRFIIENSRLTELMGSTWNGSTASACLTIPGESGEDSGLSEQERKNPVSNHTKTEGDTGKKDNSQAPTAHREAEAMQKAQTSDSGDEKHKTYVRKQVTDNWLKNYCVMRLQAKSAQPKPFGVPNGPTQKTKAEQATEWLAYFHERLDELPELERRIIEKKYLETGYNGRLPLDDIVISELFISQRQYYYRKKEALYLLGLALGEDSES